MAVKDITESFAIEIYDGATSTWVDYTGYALAGTLNIDHELNMRSICSFSLFDNDGNMTMPGIGQKVRVTDGSDKYFGGQVESLDYRAYRPGGAAAFQAVVKCTDYSALLDRYYVTETYEGLTSGAIIKALVAHMGTSDALDTTNVANGPIISRMVVPTLTIQEAIDELSRVTGYKYKVSYDGYLYWFERSSDTASWSLTDATAATRTVGLPMVKRERAQYRNVQEVRGATVVDDTDNVYPTWGANGLLTFVSGDKIYTDAYIATSLSQPIWDLGRTIASISYVYISPTPSFEDDDALTVYAAGTKSGNTLFYYLEGGSQLYMNESWTYNGTTYWWWEAFPAGQYRYIKVVGRFQSQMAAIARKTASWCAYNGEAEVDTIAQMAAIEGGSGIYHKIEVNERLTTVAECQARADGLLKQFGVIPTIVDYTSDNWGDLAIGQYQTVSIYGLSKNCVVKSIKISDVAGQWLRAQVQLVGSEKQSYAQYWRQVLGGQTARMQTTYAVRPMEIATQYTYLPDENLEVDDTSLVATEVDAFSNWGDGTIGEGAEWS